MPHLIKKALKSLQQLRIEMKNFVKDGSIHIEETHRFRAKYHLEVTEQGDLNFEKKPKALVISGGGAKGVAYAGMVTAMMEAGFLDQLTHISGASAGAMLASLISLGMSAEDINTIINELDISRLVDPGPREIRGKGITLRNALDLVYMFQMNQHLRHFEESHNKQTPTELTQKYATVKGKLLHYSKAVEEIKKKYKKELEPKYAEKNLTYNEKEFDSVKEIVFFLQNISSFEELNTCLNEKKTTGLNFKDLDLIREVLPENQKHRIKELSVAVTNTENGRLEIKNKDRSPNEPIANAVQISGAHPVIFQGVVQEGQIKADGGILDNMPIQPFLDAKIQFNDIIGICLTPENTLHQVNDELNNFNELYVSRSDRLQDSAYEQLVGGKVNQGALKVIERQIAMNYLENLILLNTGGINTLDLDASLVQKTLAIENAKKTTKEFINHFKKPSNNIIVNLLHVEESELQKESAKLLSFIENEKSEFKKTMSENYKACKTVLKVKTLQSEIISIDQYLKKIKNSYEREDYAAIIEKAEQVVASVHGEILELINDFYKENPTQAYEAIQTYSRQINLWTKNRFQIASTEPKIIKSVAKEDPTSVIYDLIESTALFIFLEVPLYAIEAPLLLIATIIDFFAEKTQQTVNPDQSPLIQNSMFRAPPNVLPSQEKTTNSVYTKSNMENKIL